MPLIGAADASLRGLRSPEGDEQKAFWSSPLSDLQSSGLGGKKFCRERKNAYICGPKEKVGRLLVQWGSARKGLN